MAKLVGEMQIEAYRLQYGIKNFLVARPANTYGPWDNFDPVSALIIPALIHRAFAGENPLVVWGDGTAVRDFVFSDDVADFLMAMVAQDAPGPYNVGSGMSLSIQDVALSVALHAGRCLGRTIEVRWDTTKATGEPVRVTSIEKAQRELGWAPKIGTDEGIAKTVEWYHGHKDRLLKRYSILSEE